VSIPENNMSIAATVSSLSLKKFDLGQNIIIKKRKEGPK
jgi:hypothetical protein